MAVDLEVRSTKKARKSALDRDVAMKLAATEYDRVVTMFKDFTVEQWAMSTDCPGWDVRAMAGHMLGMAQMVATLPELIRQQATSQRSAKKNGGVSIDSLTALQVAKNANLTAGELVENMRRAAPRAVRGRRRVPAIILNRRMPEAQGVGGQLELWTFGYLFDVILTRDPFMHRLDITQATGVPMRATADHEGVLVDDIVREWAGLLRRAVRHVGVVRRRGICAGPSSSGWEAGLGGGLSRNASGVEEEGSHQPNADGIDDRTDQGSRRLLAQRDRTGRRLPPLWSSVARSPTRTGGPTTATSMRSSAQFLWRVKPPASRPACQQWTETTSIYFRLLF